MSYKRSLSASHYSSRSGTPLRLNVVRAEGFIDPLRPPFAPFRRLQRRLESFPLPLKYVASLG